MYIFVREKKIEVSVTESGTFHDTETKTFNSKTLSGLRKKMLAATSAAATAGVLVYSGTRSGVVIGRKGGKGWSKDNFRVRWNDNNTVTEHYGELYRPFTPEETAELEKLAAKADEAYQIAHEARAEHNEYLKARSITNDLDQIFPKS